MEEIKQGLTAEQKKEMQLMLAEYDEFVEQFTARAKSVQLHGPAQMVGLLNVLGMVYKKTVEQGFDLRVKDCPLIALPNHLKMMEDRMNAVLETVATTTIKTIVEKGD